MGKHFFGFFASPGGNESGAILFEREIASPSTANGRNDILDQPPKKRLPGTSKYQLPWAAYACTRHLSQ